MTPTLVTRHSAEQRESLESALKAMPVEIRHDEPMARHTSFAHGKVTLISSETILISRTPSLYSQSTSAAMFFGERMRT